MSSLSSNFAQEYLPVSIGLLDTGVDATHPALADKVQNFVLVNGLGQVRRGLQAYDTAQHGTHIARILCGRAFQNMEGLAPNAMLQVVAVEQSGKVILKLLKGMDLLLDRDISLACMPIGIQSKSPIFKPLLDVFEEKGILPVLPIGNGGDGRFHSPGWYPNVLSVGAVDQASQPLPFSGCLYDENGQCLKPDILAPGKVLSSHPNGKVKTMQGTSAACAYTAGIAARLLEQEPQMTANQLKAALIASANPIPRLANRHYNYQKGIVNLESVLKRDDPFKGRVQNSQDEPFFDQPYFDAYFIDKYNRAGETSMIESIIGIKSPKRRKAGNKAIRKIIQGWPDKTSIEQVAFFKHVNMAQIKASKKFYNQFFALPVFAMVSALDINIFAQQE